MPAQAEPFEPIDRQFDGEEAATPRTEPVVQRSDGRRAVAAMGADPAAGPRLIDGVRETVELLAASYVADGKSIPDAARLAVEQLVTSDKDLVEELRAESASGQRPEVMGSTTDLAVAKADLFGRTESDTVASREMRANEQLDVHDGGSSDRRAVRSLIEGTSVAQSGLPPTPRQKPIVPPLPKQKPPVQLPPPTLPEITPLTPAGLNALRGPVVLTPANDPLPRSHVPLRFRNMISERESPNRGYKAFNPNGDAWGRYQLTPVGRKQIGLERKDGKLTGKYGVHSKQGFMNDPIAQERAFLDLVMSDSKDLGKNGAVKFVGQEIDGILAKFTVTMDGLVAAAHRRGPRGTKDYLLHLKKHGWKSDASTFPAGQQEKFKEIETRLREFENVPYLKIRQKNSRVNSKINNYKQIRLPIVRMMSVDHNLFSHRLLWLSLGLIVIVLSGSVSLVNAGNADGQIVLKPGEIGPDVAFVRGYLAARGDTESDPEEFYVGRHDLNNDGQLELFVVFYEPGYCGTAGCEMMIFEKMDSSWNAFAGMYVHGPSYGHGDEILLETKDEGAPYLTVYGYHLGVRWDGTSYRGFCIGRECERPEWRN